jgi:hypothetical protein
MGLTIYDRAVDYAYNLSRPLCKDIIHDTFIHFYDRTKKNLFEQEEIFVKKMILKTFLKKYLHSQYKFRQLTERLVANLETPEDQIIAQESFCAFIGYDEITDEIGNYVETPRVPRIHLN